MSAHLDELRVRVAECLGWSHINRPSPLPWMSTTLDWLGTNPSGNMDRPVPDFTGSLDACASLRATLTEAERLTFAVELACIVAVKLTEESAEEWWLIANAGAPEICQAWLNTVAARNGGRA